MPVPSLITDLSTTAASNSPAGAESARGTIDDYLRAHASFIAQTRAGTSATTYTYSGTGARIQGDFSTATFANRTAFQDKTTNGGTSIYALPNGTATESGWNAWNKSDPTNGGYVGISISSTEAALYASKTGTGGYVPLLIYAGGAEAARFTSSGGNFLLGTTNVVVATQTGYFCVQNNSAGRYAIATDTPNQSGTYYHISFGSAGAFTGAIQGNGTSTSYLTSSDYRLKVDQQAITESGAFIDALQPKTWTWLSNGSVGVGFIAHEVATVSPTSVYGEKDAVNADGSPKYQGMEYGSAEFIANIVAELQSLRARVAALEAA